MNLKHFVMPEHKEVLKERERKVEGYQKNSGVDLRVYNGYSWNYFSKIIYNGSIEF